MLKKVLRNAVTVLSAVMILLSCALVHTAAEEVPMFTVSDVNCKVGDEVTVTVECSGNPGISAWKVEVSYYTDALELVGCNSNGVFGTALTSQTLDTVPFVVSWSNGLENVSANGTLMELTFRVKDNALVGDYLIHLTYDEDDVYSVERGETVTENNVYFGVKDGKITVKDDSTPVDSITVAPTEKTLKAKGETFTIIPTVLPENATNKNVSFKSSDESVATVNSNGVVTAVANGTATITAVTEDGNKTAECKVTVKIPHVHTMIKIDGKESTCIEQGNNTYYKCDACGKYFKDPNGNTETTPDNEKLPLASHTGGTAACNHKAVCAVCGEEYGDYAAHKYGEWTVTKQATTTENGTKEHTCSVCGHKEAAEIPAITGTDTEKPTNPTDSSKSSDTDKKSTSDTPGNSATSSKTTTATNNANNGTSTYAPKTGAASSVFITITVAVFALATMVVIKKIRKV